MSFNSMTVGQIVTAITSVGIISAFMFKLFSLFSEVKQDTRSIQRAHERIDKIQEQNKQQKDELLGKVEETNNAVNLLCTAVSGLIEDALQDNDESKKQLKEIKHKLDNKKEII